MTLPPKITRAIDTGGLAVALAVDLTMNVICFSVIAPDWITRIAFIAVGVMIVLFVLRSLAKRQFAVWAVFVSVVFFFDYSFALETTKIQGSAVTASTDTECVRLLEAKSRSDATIADLHEQYKTAMKRETLEELDAQIIAEQARSDRYEAQYDARAKELASGHERAKITADSVFYAVPTAYADGRYVPMIVFALVFFGLQLIIFTSMTDKTETQHQAPEPVRKPAKKRRTVKPAAQYSREDVERFVHWSWYRVKARTSDYLMDYDGFSDIARLQGVEYPRDKYDALVARCRRMKLVGADGRVMTFDEAKAIETLEGSVQEQTK